MENQGKKPEQIKYSEDVSFYAIIGLIVILLITLIIK